MLLTLMKTIIHMMWKLRMLQPKNNNMYLSVKSVSESSKIFHPAAESYLFPSYSAQHSACKIIAALHNNHPEATPAWCIWVHMSSCQMYASKFPSCSPPGEVWKKKPAVWVAFLCNKMLSPLIKVETNRTSVKMHEQVDTSGYQARSQHCKPNHPSINPANEVLNNKQQQFLWLADPLATKK